MRTLKSEMVEDAVNAFCDPQDFAERITFLPAAGHPREFYAVVDRSPQERIIGPRDGAHRIFTVACANHPVDGISPATLDTGGDLVRLSEHPGGHLVTMSVFKIHRVDHGMVLLELR